MTADARKSTEELQRQARKSNKATLCTLFFGDKEFSFRILQINENAKKQDCSEMYEVIDEQV